jgi:hypothetical protein
MSKRLGNVLTSHPVNELLEEHVMVKVLEVHAPRKAPKAFFAHLYDRSGVLAKVGAELVFFDDNAEDITTVEPQDCNFLTVLGEIGLADGQRVLDLMHGGAVGLCVSRAQEVR